MRSMRLVTSYSQGLKLACQHDQGLNRVIVEFPGDALAFVPMGILLKGEHQVVAAAGKVAGDLANLNLHGFLGNLISVTTGNIFGGGFMVAAVYWFIYLRPKEVEMRTAARTALGLFFAPRRPGNPTKQS
jgi:hypothetical protein